MEELWIILNNSNKLIHTFTSLSLAQATRMHIPAFTNQPAKVCPTDRGAGVKGEAPHTLLPLSHPREPRAGTSQLLQPNLA